MKVPEHLAHLPTTRSGVPVPHVAAWSSERWGKARWDSLVGRFALFSEGRQYRGKPILASLNEERQRRSVQLSRCQVCDRQFLSKELLVTTLTLHPVEVDGVRYACTTSPPTCELCLEFSQQVCPGLRRDYEVVPFDRCLKVLQFLDPSAAPMEKIEQFDRGDNPTTRERLGRFARAHGGLVGVVKLAIPPELIPALVMV